MKLKIWLREFCNMSISEYKALPEIEQYSLFGDFTDYNRRQQLKASNTGWRLMTEEERKRGLEWAEKERKRYEENVKIGGIDETGNYTALHHRHN